ncbi:MAG: type I glyceraldehyde-3-phosphate dehydrogenase, partial [Elusimicrobia bacterium]|nr:type I glyceraldehyde-3-phosphate dehydrogenase [Elusimicrobiota bacterium]
MAINVGINGFGRIGRLVLRAGIKHPALNFVAVNDLTDAPTLAHLFKHDSNFGNYPGSVEAVGSDLRIDGRTVKVQALPGKLGRVLLGQDLD